MNSLLTREVSMDYYIILNLYIKKKIKQVIA